MEYIATFDINKFKFWDGAVQVVQDFKERGKLDLLVQMIEELGCDNQQVTDEQINSFVWFEAYRTEEMYEG